MAHVPIDTVKTVEASPTKKRQLSMPMNKAVLLVIAISIFGLIVGGLAGYTYGSNHHKLASNSTSRRMNGRRMKNGANGSGRIGSGISGRKRLAQGLRIEGAVTSVNDSSFTLVGEGNTYTITTNGNTKWAEGESSVSVNDTVIVTYGGSGTNLTAKSVRVVNGAKQSKPTSGGSQQ